MRTSLVPLILCFVLTLAGLTLLTSFHDASTVTHVWGMPVIAFGAEKPAWLAFGGVGVLVLGAGAGLVSLSIVGVGLLFATGQLALGLIAIGQVGLGPMMFLGQMGAGLHVGAQAGLGRRRWTQGNNQDEKYFQSLWRELKEILNPGGGSRG